jgi:predicted MFS family arabinose efflux permease
MKPQHPSLRWVVLFSYILTGLLSQVIWITFAPILTISAQAYSVSATEIGYLSAVFPLVYIIISIPVGYFIDSYGFRKAVLVGTGLMAVFGLLRAFSPNFTSLLIFQTLAAFGQPFIMNSISKLVKGWFPERESGLATGLGSLSLYLGTIVGLILTPVLVEVMPLADALLFYGAFSMAVLAVFFFLGKASPTHTSEREYVEISKTIGVFKNRNIMVLSVLFFICIGIFTAFTTWIEPILGVQGIDAASAGLLGGIMIIGGIVGSVAIPGISDRRRDRKRPLVLCLLVSAALWYALSFISGFLATGVALFAIGFIFMPALPLSLALSAESVDKKYVGAANSILYEFSQIGALLLIFLFEAIAGAFSWNAAIVLSAALIFVSMLASLLVKEQLKKP